MSDPAQKETDRLIAEMEKRIAAEYKQAEKEIAAKLKDYMQRFETKDRIWQKWVADGKETKEAYMKWRLGQVMVGKRWEEMRNTLAQDFQNANRIAGSIVNGYRPEVYALNHDYATFQVEKDGLVDTSYSLYDRQTAERLFRDNPQMLPPPGKQVSQEIREGKAVRWNQQQIQSVMVQSLLQGESIPDIATRLANAVGDSNRKAAVRNARTMATGAQNAGRQDAYKRAEDMGVKMEREWIATLDMRTRHEHRMLDGERAAVDEPFVVPGTDDKIMYPGDPTADPHMVYNCRCTTRAVVDGWESKTKGLRSMEDLEGMTYEEWKNAKEKLETVDEKPYDSRESYISYKKSLENERWQEKKQEIEMQRDREIENLLNDKYGGDFFDQRSKIRNNDALTDEEKEQLIDELYDKRQKFRDDKWEIERKYQTIINEAHKNYMIVDLDYEGLIHRPATESMWDGVKAVNPNFWTGAFEYTNNCQRCSLATEIWYRGYSVEAMPCDSFGGLGAQAKLQWAFQDGERKHFSGGRDAIVGIVEQMEEWGSGSRAMIFTQPGSGTGHVFNVVNDNGVVRFIDSQAGMIWGTDEQSVAEIFGGTVETSVMTDLMRTDDTRIYDLPEGWIKNRE